jgi:hypothetical protein
MIFARFGDKKQARRQNMAEIVSGRGHFQDFRPGFRFWHICHVDRHGHFTLKQLRLPVHTNSYTGPRL